MGVTVGVNSMSVVHADSGGSIKIYPDTCKTPSPTGVAPITYTNSASSSDTSSASKTVKCDGNPICHEDSNFSTSTGDEAGTAGGGVKSSTIKGKCTFVNYSFDVKVEGKKVARAQDLMLHNNKNTLPSPVMQGPIIVAVETEKPVCLVCKKGF